jgi:hypothetical protein
MASSKFKLSVGLVSTSEHTSLVLVFGYFHTGLFFPQHYILPIVANASTKVLLQKISSICDLTLFFYFTFSCCVPIFSYATKYPGAWNMPGIMYEGSHNMPSIMYNMDPKPKHVSRSTDCIINYGEIYCLGSGPDFGSFKSFNTQLWSWVND